MQRLNERQYIVGSAFPFNVSVNPAKMSVKLPKKLKPLTIFCCQSVFIFEIHVSLDGILCVVLKFFSDVAANAVAS